MKLHCIVQFSLQYFFNTSFCVFEEYSVRHSEQQLQGTVQCPMQCTVRCAVTCSVQCTVQCKLQFTGSREEVKPQRICWPATLTSGYSALYTVQYSVQCTVQCTLYCSVQYRYVGCPGNQWDVTITKGKRKKSFLIAFRHNNLFPLLR